MHYRSGRTYTHTHTTPRHFPPSLPPFLPFSPFFSFVCRYIVIRDASVADWFEALVRSIADFSSGVDGSGALHPPSGVGQPQQQQQLAVDSVHVAVVVVMWLWLCGCACVHVVVVVSPLIPSSKLSLSPSPLLLRDFLTALLCPARVSVAPQPRSCSAPHRIAPLSQGGHFECAHACRAWRQHAGKVADGHQGVPAGAGLCSARLTKGCVCVCECVCVHVCVMCVSVCACVCAQFKHRSHSPLSSSFSFFLFLLLPSVRVPHQRQRH